MNAHLDITCVRPVSHGRGASSGPVALEATATLPGSYEEVAASQMALTAVPRAKGSQP